MLNKITINRKLAKKNKFCNYGQFFMNRRTF